MPADRRASRIAVIALRLAAAAASLSLAPRVWAGASGDPVEPHASSSAGSAGPTAGSLDHQLADQSASIDRAFAAIRDKLAAADQARRRRLAAALRVARAAPTDDAAAVARRRAAARVLLDRDRSERGLLSDELDRLQLARDRVAGERGRLPAIALPTELARPAPGKIARHFGTLEHERSHATLSRRGIDLEVPDHCPVTAPAAGTVRYAGPIRGLDHGIILDHGDYLTVIAKLGGATLPVGSIVAAGDPLGRAARHRVYLEVRVKLGPGGLPIDPEPLINGGGATTAPGAAATAATPAAATAAASGRAPVATGATAANASPPGGSRPAEHALD